MDALKQAIRELRKEQAKEKVARKFKPPETLQEFYEQASERAALGLLPRRKRRKKKPGPKKKNTKWRKKEKNTPCLRDTPWKTVAVRMEQYTMLRELSAHYKQRLGTMLGMLVEEEYFLVLRETGGKLKAEIIEKRYVKERVVRKQNRDALGRFLKKGEISETSIDSGRSVSDAPSD